MGVLGTMKENKNVRWSEKEIRELKRLYPKANKEEVKKALEQRTWAAIMKKAHYLKVIRVVRTHTKEKWSKTEEKILQEKYPCMECEKLLKLLPNRSWESICNHANKIGVKRELRNGWKENSYWSEKQIQYLHRNYGKEDMKVLEQVLGKDKIQIMRKVRAEGLLKDNMLLRIMETQKEAKQRGLI